MSAARRPISIHDYPEHLNPFSENHLTFQDRRKMLADKLRKNGTWSSKISKRLSRSVSWLEKSWLTAEESQKKSNSNGRICDKVHEFVYQNSEQTNGLSRTDSYLDVHHHYENNLPYRTEITTKSDDDEEPPAIQSSSKPEPKRRKKRPAPLPPIADSKVDSNEKNETESEYHHSEITSSDINAGDQNANANSAGSSGPEEVTKTCQRNSVDEPETNHKVDDDDDGGGGGSGHVSSTSDKCDSPPPSRVVADHSHCSRLESGESNAEINREPVSRTEQPVDQQLPKCSVEGTATTVDHIQHQSNGPTFESQEVPTQLSPPLQADVDQVLDENANISYVQSASTTTENQSARCNGNAVAV